MKTKSLEIIGVDCVLGEAVIHAASASLQFWRQATAREHCLVSMQLNIIISVPLARYAKGRGVLQSPELFAILRLLLCTQ